MSSPRSSPATVRSFSLPAPATRLTPCLTAGMTESTALTTVLTPEFFQYGSVGVPVPSCEIKLVDFAEAGYFSSNTRPQGEVWIRGPSVSYGYCSSFSLSRLRSSSFLYAVKRPDLTAESMTADGWMQTGVR